MLEVLSYGVNFILVYGQVRGFEEFLTGKDYITGRELDPIERVLFINNTAKGIAQIDNFLSGLKPSKQVEMEVELPGFGKMKLDGDLDELDSKKFETSKNKNYNSGNNVNENTLKPQDVSLSDFTQKGGKIQNFVEGIKGKSYNELEKLFDEELVNKLGYEKSPLTIGGAAKGYKYVLPNGKSIFLEKGWGNFQDPLHNGPYVRIPGTQNGILRVPLDGNPVLK